MLIAVISLCGVSFAFSRRRPADANPNDAAARALLAQLRDGARVDLAQVYPERWDSVQLAHGTAALTSWEWRTLCAFDPYYAQSDDEQLLIFWREQAISRVIHFAASAEGAPWFTTQDEAWENFFAMRDSAVFEVMQTQEDGRTVFVCLPEGRGEVEV